MPSSLFAISNAFSGPMTMNVVDSASVVSVFGPMTVTLSMPCVTGRPVVGSMVCCILCPSCV